MVNLEEERDHWREYLARYFVTEVRGGILQFLRARVVSPEITEAEFYDMVADALETVARGLRNPRV